VVIDETGRISLTTIQTDITDQYGVYWEFTDGSEETYIPLDLDLQIHDGDADGGDGEAGRKQNGVEAFGLVVW
jgi:hypothetical protein